MADIPDNPAQIASKVALREVFAAIGNRQSFRLEAGAGAGKTYSLIEALRHLLELKSDSFQRSGQKIACITYTNVAKNEILERIDNSPFVFAETIHAFSWSLLKRFSKEIRPLVSSLTDNWKVRVEEFGGIQNQQVVYDLGYPGIYENTITLHHDDVIKIMTEFLRKPKFVSILKDRYPIVFIDEYQDTNVDLAKSIVTNLVENENGILVGFFGDHWQKIYGSRACGLIQSERGLIKEIGKNANFRSDAKIVDALNRMRPSLPQEVSDPLSVGNVLVFHSNDWTGSRQGGAHWKDDLPPDLISEYLSAVLGLVEKNGYRPDQQGTKILMLTNGLLADEQGYKSIASLFDDTDDFLKPNDPYLLFFKETLDPLCELFAAKKYGEMLALLGQETLKIATLSDKKVWIASIGEVIRTRSTATVGEVVEVLKKTRRPRLSPKIEELELKISKFESLPDDEKADFSRRRERIIGLKEIKYAEVVALNRYVDDKTPYSTKHGVKGAEFENVVVVFGRGWNQYNWSQMLEWVANGVPSDKNETFERSRNLFYVACSRARKRLTLIFTQKLSDPALHTLSSWFGWESLRTMGSVYQKK